MQQQTTTTGTTKDDKGLGCVCLLVGVYVRVASSLDLFCCSFLLFFNSARCA